MTSVSYFGTNLPVFFHLIIFMTSQHIKRDILPVSTGSLTQNLHNYTKFVSALSPNLNSSAPLTSLDTSDTYFSRAHRISIFVVLPTTPHFFSDAAAHNFCVLCYALTSMQVNGRVALS